MSLKCFMLDPINEDANGVSDGERMYKRRDTGEILASRVAHNIPGAMWLATWYLIEGSNPPRYMFDWENQTTPPLIVCCPGGGHWDIDSRASNCGMKTDKTHRCWIRHGEPPEITVDKNGHTCNAGGGSIQCENYHGFLRNGVFT